MARFVGTADWLFLSGFPAELCCRRYRPQQTELGPQLDLFIFDCSPNELEEDVIPPRAFCVYADLDSSVCQHFDKLRLSEVAPLIRLEDLGGPMPGQCFLDSLNAKVNVLSDRHPPRKDTMGEPVDDRRNKDEATRHRNVGYVHCPDPVWPNDRQVMQEIWVVIVPGRRL